MKTKIKHLLSVLLCVAMLIGAMSSTALAASKTSGKCGKNLKWSYDKSSDTLTISGKGAMNDYKSLKSPWFDCLEEFGEGTKVVIKEGVTTIGKNAFDEVPISGVSLPKTLKTIGDRAFGGVVNGSLEGGVTIPKSVTKIGVDAFGSVELESITVEKGNKKYASVKGVLFDKKKTTLIQCPTRKSGSFTIPSTTKKIESGAFFGCDLTRLTVPKSVKTIGSETFTWASMDVYFKGEAPKKFDRAISETECTFYYPQKYKNSWKKYFDSEPDASWKTWDP